MGGFASLNPPYLPEKTGGRYLELCYNPNKLAGILKYWGVRMAMKQKLISCILLMGGLIALSSVYAYPQFCCSDSNWQQQMLDNFHDPQTNTTNFSYPPGVFRRACTNCEYDMKTVSCYCQDVAGQVSYFPSYFTLDQCQQPYANRGGFILCWK